MGILRDGRPVARPYSANIIRQASPFHAHRKWGQSPFSLVLCVHGVDTISINGNCPHFQSPFSAQTYPPSPEPLHPVAIPPTSRLFAIQGFRGRAWTSRARRKHGPGRHDEVLAQNQNGSAAIRPVASRMNPGLPAEHGDGTVRSRRWAHPERQWFTGLVRQGGLAACFCKRFLAVTPPCAWK